MFQDQGKFCGRIQKILEKMSKLYWSKMPESIIIVFDSSTKVLWFEVFYIIGTQTENSWGIIVENF